MTLFVFQCAIAFNSPVSVIRGAGGGGGLGGGWGWSPGICERKLPGVRTFDYRQVAGVGTFEFHLISDAILDWKLLKTWLPVS